MKTPKVPKNTENISSDIVEYNAEKVSLPKSLLEEIHNFIALSNNHLMNIPVQGDDILHSAEIMKLAGKLHKELEEIKNGK